MLNIKAEPWRLYEIENPTEEECLISVKDNPNYIFMVKNLTPSIIKLTQLKLVGLLYIQLWYDLRTLKFNYYRHPINNQYQLGCFANGSFCLNDIKHNKIINVLPIEEFYPLFYNHFRKELRTNKLKNI